MPAVQSFNLCKPRETMRTLQSRTLQWNCWLYPFCDNHRHLSIKRNKFRHYQFVPTFCSSAQIWFFVPEAVQVFIIFKRSYFWPNQHNVSVTVKMRPFYFKIWLWIVFDIGREQIKAFCYFPVKGGVFFLGGRGVSCSLVRVFFVI